MKRLTALLISLAFICSSGCTQTPQPARPAQAPPKTTGTFAPDRAAPPQTLTICSFNIKFLGHYKNRKNATLVNLIRNYDIVVVQELVAPPYPLQFPDGTPAKPDGESQAFFDQMRSAGFSYILSAEDTGAGEKIHDNGPGTEWFVAFYKPAQVQIAADLPCGFVESDRSRNGRFDRVPCAFGFRTPGRTLDFVLVDVHLRAGNGPDHRTRRRSELATISQWVHDHDQFEKDFIILGDMNIENAAELSQDTPAGFVSLNKNCLPTTCSAANGKNSPFDHVMYQPQHTTTCELDTTYGFHVVDLVEAVRPTWLATNGPFPGDPYVDTKFAPLYSDHRPVFFRMTVPATDDDPNP